MGSAANPLGGAPYGDQSSTYANNLYLLGENQQQNQGVLQPTGATALKAGATGLADVSNYESGILSGNREQVLATEAPEISSMLSSYNAQRKAAAELEPRGGGRSATLNELPYKELGDVNKLVESARPKAAAQLSETSAAQAGIGLSAEQLASENVQTSLDFLLGKAGIQLKESQLNQQNGQAVGSAIAQLLPLIAGAGAGA